MNRVDMPRWTLMTAVILLLFWTPASALNPEIDIRQYAHRGWKIADGAFNAGVIFDVAQTPDGYLWVATDAGLFRFDGVRSAPWQPPAGAALPNNDVRVLHTARDGTLWIGTSRGVASWKEGELTRYPVVDGLIVESLIEDHEGTIWVGTSTATVGRLCSIQNGKTECNDYGGRFGAGVTAVYADSRGNVWAGARTGLWRWLPGPPTLYSLPDPDFRINAMIESDDGGILVTKDTGITNVRNGQIEPFPLPRGLEFKPGCLLRDRDGGLWIGAVVDSGLLHIHNGRFDLYSQSDGLSGNTVPALFEDREGSIWVAAADGLDRFREFAVTTMFVDQGLSSHGVESVVSAKDGTIWIATDDGLDKWNNGEITVYRRRSPPSGSTASAPARNSRVVRTIIDRGLPADLLTSAFEDSLEQLWVTSESGVAILKSDRFVPVSSLPHGLVRSIAEDRKGTVWLSQQQGLFGLREGRVVEQIPWSTFGHEEPATALVRDDVDDGVWLGFRDGSIARFTQGRVAATYATGEGLATLYADANGGVWAATDAGLSRIKDGQVLTLNSQNGLPCSTVHWMMKDGAGAVWLYTACGLIRIAESDLDAWTASSTSKLQATVFDAVDGVHSQQFHYGYSSLVTMSPDSRLWFVSSGGLSVIDPARIPFNATPPPVHIEQIIADRQAYATEHGLRLPPLSRDVEIDFTALSFVAPEKVRFRYKLEGYDDDWQEAGNRHQAFYTNLPPRAYRFRVQACNNSGIWNEEGALLDFSIAPAVYQTIWFRLFVAAALLALLVVLYRRRIHRLRQRERELQQTVETMPAMAFIALPDGARLFVNQRWVDYTGLNVEQASGSGWQAAVHPEDLDRVLKKWRDALVSGEPLEYEMRLRRTVDGQYRWFLTRAVPLRNRSGEIVKWYGVTTDIEERERLRQLESEMAHINRVSMLGELTASLAHEIRQPIAAALTNANACMRWLKHDPPDLEEVRAAVDRISRDGNRAAEIITRLRSFYTKGVPPKRESVNVNDIVAELVMLLRSEVDRHAITMRTDLMEDFPAVRADRVQLLQVLVNLTLNAVDAMRETGGELTIKSRYEDGQVIVSVSDTGIGLPPETIEDIFSAFFTTKAHGTGMGLAISRSIIEAHGGRLWATINDGPGASFHFRIPGESHSDLV
ncbi:MAG: PAS domain-containing protein [Acidobacteria bacterium]|nr:PAS domain-containing protein [Acidobacteriota bacterium]